MADGEIVFEATISDKKLHQELNKVKSNIESLQKEFNRLGAQKTPMEDRLRNIGAELDAAKQVLADMRTAPKGTYEKIDVSEQDISGSTSITYWPEAAPKCISGSTSYLQV